MRHRSVPGDLQCKMLLNLRVFTRWGVETAHSIECLRKDRKKRQRDRQGEHLFCTNPPREQEEQGTGGSHPCHCSAKLKLKPDFSIQTWK